MKKLSEVCKIVGVTRRTLQEYDRIGLLKPTSKTESGYWLYDTSAIQTLMAIQVFVECGYERKKIKAMLESPSVDLLDEYDCLIKNLEDKREKIDGMINFVKFLKINATLPESVIQAMSDIDDVDFARIYADKSFTSIIEDLFSKSTEMEYMLTDQSMLLLLELITIGNYLGIPEETDCVQEVVEEAYKSLVEIVRTNEKYRSVEISETIFAKVFLEVTKDLVGESELQKKLDRQLGEGATEYIIRAVELFCNKILAAQEKGSKGER
ncbi:MAG: MerR family transcriptional regulator [Lachnospiraceae bacterium]|nr:MerR family transcriptional regulator [Lachnospiraceae bacterium]